MTNGLSQSFTLDESIFILGESGEKFHFLFYFSMKIKKANRIAPDGTPRFAVSHLGLYSVCLWPIKRTTCLYGLTFCLKRNSILTKEIQEEKKTKSEKYLISLPEQATSKHRLIRTLINITVRLSDLCLRLVRLS